MDRGLEEPGLAGLITGKTPVKSLDSALSTHIRLNGTESAFVRTSRGRFQLREQLSNTVEAVAEQILVFPPRLLSGEYHFQGVRADWKTFHNRVFDLGPCMYAHRDIAECTTEYKQVISFVLVTSNGLLLSYLRSEHPRVPELLRGRSTLGFGGHLSLSDLSVLTFSDFGLEYSVWRELSEELGLPLPTPTAPAVGMRLSPIGVLNDDSTLLGRKHFAFVYHLDIGQGSLVESLRSPDPTCKSLVWLEPEEACSGQANLEGWSQWCLFLLVNQFGFGQQPGCFR